ncbi:hypothetical protein D9M68_628580 [compost metagenome]
MPVGKAPRGQREKHLGQREQRDQQADGRCAVALLQCEQRGGEPHARHRGVQTDLRHDDAQQFRTFHGVSSASLSVSAVGGSNACDCASGKASTLRSARRICLARVSALSMVSEALATCSLMRATHSP